jgi:hypothetical protein
VTAAAPRRRPLRWRRLPPPSRHREAPMSCRTRSASPASARLSIVRFPAAHSAAVSLSLPLDVPVSPVCPDSCRQFFWVADPTVRFLRERMDQAGCPVWPLLIRAATCAESSGGYASKHGVCSSFSFHFSLPKNRVLYVGTALAWAFYVGKFICTAAIFLCFTPTTAIVSCPHCRYVWCKEVCVVAHKS